MGSVSSLETSSIHRVMSSCNILCFSLVIVSFRSKLNQVFFSEIRVCVFSDSGKFHQAE